MRSCRGAGGCWECEGARFNFPDGLDVGLRHKNLRKTFLKPWWKCRHGDVGIGLALRLLGISLRSLLPFTLPITCTCPAPLPLWRSFLTTETVRLFQLQARSAGGRLLTRPDEPPHQNKWQCGCHNRKRWLFFLKYKSFH